ncbi:hypothetical protein TcasGA2_TC034667 [Tribolium castaneum]|uniref:Secreted protein n=1 Tax=Tribolium castaneum TaxID=7070 RepID=A0A139WJE4_TRICA|nr:hypothetical protein TcasGA2_TC034667 [Tribolium castaneum]
MWYFLKLTFLFQIALFMFFIRALASPADKPESDQVENSEITTPREMQRQYAIFTPRCSQIRLNKRCRSFWHDNTNNN